MRKRSFVDLAEAMPEEKWTFKPSGGAFDNVRTFAEQVKHVACANEAFASEVDHKEPPPACDTGGPNPAKSKAEIMRYLRQSFTQVNEVFAKMTPGNALDAARGRDCRSPRARAQAAPTAGPARGWAWRRSPSGTRPITTGSWWSTCA